MKKSKPTTEPLEQLTPEVCRDDVGDQDRRWEFLRAIEEHVTVPCEGAIAGHPVTILKFGYDGNFYRGLFVNCKGADGKTYTLSAADVTIARNAKAARDLAAYRNWMLLKPLSHPKTSARLEALSEAGPADDHSGGKAELVVVSASVSAVQCRLLGSQHILTFRPSSRWIALPGEIVRVRVDRRWQYGNHDYLSGSVESTRVDAAALQLEPLPVHECGMWDPSKEMWAREGLAWERRVRRLGPRRIYQMEQVIPGEDPDNRHTDPIIDAMERWQVGDDFNGAYEMLMAICKADLRCLDAHAHLGIMRFDRWPEIAVRHYEVGVRIGESWLGPKFNGLLPWFCINNRPFLRCMNGYGLCLWRLNRFSEAAGVFHRMLLLNPVDNQGIRCLIEDVKAKRKWVPQD
ncbi:MAG: hypothetical protein JNL98_29360 [Bryobacterales bacterium]|nr:hypothetical protein [Bryobacterales bacterium]